MDGRADEARRRSLAGPVSLTVIGAVLVITAVVMWVVAVDRTGDVFEEAFAGRSSFDGETAVPGELEVTLDVGPRRVYAIDEGAFTATSSTEVPSQTDPVPDLVVTVTGPDGEDVPVREVHDELGFPDLGTGAILYGAAAFDVHVAGSYTVTVTAAPRSTPVDQAGVGPPTDIGEALGEGLEGALLTLVGMLVGVVGLATLIAGVIWLAVAASSSRRPPPPPPGQWGPPGGWGPPPSQWQQPSGSWGPPSGQWGPH